MDSWDANQKLMAQIAPLGKIYACPLKHHRWVDDSGDPQSYQRIDVITWDTEVLAPGKLIKLRGFPKDKKVKLFRVAASSHQTEFVVTNDLIQTSTAAAQAKPGVRGKIEEFHRELKQLTGVEACQCRRVRIQRNHIACTLLVWSRLKVIADQRTNHLPNQA